MRWTLLLVLFPSILIGQHRKCGDTLVFTHWPDSVHVFRVDTVNEKGQIRSTNYCKNGRVGETGILKWKGRDYYARRDGYWTFSDTSGRMWKSETHCHHKLKSTCAYNGEGIDSAMRKSFGRSVSYHYDSERLTSFNRSRREWLVPGILHVVYNAGLSSEWSSGEIFNIRELHYDSTGKIIYNARFFRGEEFRITHSDSTGTTHEKYSIRGKLRVKTIFDTTGIKLERSRYQHMHGRVGYPYQPCKLLRKYYPDGTRQLKKRTDKYYTREVRYYANGRKSQVYSTKHQRNKNRSWDENGQRLNVTKEIYFMRFNYYVRKSWDSTTHKKTVTHKRPSRFD